MLVCGLQIISTDLGCAGDNDVDGKKGGRFQYGAVEFDAYAEKPPKITDVTCDTEKSAGFSRLQFHRQDMLDFINEQCRAASKWGINDSKYNPDDTAYVALYAYTNSKAPFNSDVCILGLTILLDSCKFGSWLR